MESVVKNTRNQFMLTYKNDHQFFFKVLKNVRFLLQNLSFNFPLYVD